MTNIKNLMGSQLQDLEVFKEDPVIQSWVNRQLQADLDKLGLNLTTNRTNPTTAPLNSNNSTNATTTQGKIHIFYIY